jgi:hypothetical protein
MQWWIVRYRAEYYKLEQRLASPGDVTTRGVPDSLETVVKRGDVFFFAVSEKGLVGRGVVLADPILANEPHAELKFTTPRHKYDRPRLRVFVDITDRLEELLPFSQIRKEPGLAGLSVFTNGCLDNGYCPVTEPEAQLLDALIGAKK